MKVLISALVVAAPALAVAGGKVLPANEHSPPIVLDEARTSLELVPRGSDGYFARAKFGIVGMTSDTDRVRMEIKQKGKVVATKGCGVWYGDYSRVECYWDDKPLKVTGPIEIDLIYSDDQTDKEYLARTLKTSVVHVKGQWESWQVVSDDVLAGAWAWMGYADVDDGRYRRPVFYMWFTSTGFLGNAKLRCTAAGKKLPDIAISPQSGWDSEEVELDHQPAKGDRLTYRWVKAKLMPDILYGTRDSLHHDMGKNLKPDGILSDNPGTWECFLRVDGKNIRQLTFNVDQEGMIVADEIQSGKNAIPAIPGVVFIDARPTKDATAYDQRIVPAAMKKSLQYGLPWPDHPKVKTIHASFPPKSGLPDPK